MKPIREAISFAGEVERKVKTNIDANQKLVFKALESLQNNEKFSDNSDEAYLDYSDLNDERSSSKVDLNLMKPQAFDDKIVARNPNAPYPYNNDGSSNKVEDLAWKIWRRFLAMRLRLVELWVKWRELNILFMNYSNDKFLSAWHMIE